MSRSSVFQLISQDSCIDNFFTAYSYLSTRINKLKNNNINPTIKDIEASHRLFIKNQYIPYVTLLSDYVKVSPVSSSNNTLGISGGTIEFVLPNTGHFTSDLVLHISFGELGNINAYLNDEVPTANQPLYRYCAYPGIRLLEKVELISDNLLIDSYVPEDVIAYKNFFVRNSHQSGWDRVYGQDEVRKGSYNNKNFIGILNYSNGFQTPKLYHEEFNMFIPLRFWFCEDVSESIMNSNITNSQRRIRITLSNITNIIQSLTYNIENNNPPPNVVHYSTEITPLPIKTHKMSVTLYANNLFTNPEIYNIIKNELVFNLIRIHKHQITSLESEKDNILLNKLNFPCEYIMMGFRNKNNKNDFDRWHLMGSNYLTSDPNHLNSIYVPTIVWNKALQIRQLISHQITEISDINNIIKNIGITIYGGIILYPTLPYNFYSDYVPIKYNKNSLNCSPRDKNMFLISFCPYPGKFETNGYYNLSTSREIYINYEFKNEYSDIVNNAYEMVLSASSLNFLIYKDDSIRLKYTM